MELQSYQTNDGRTIRYIEPDESAFIDKPLPWQERGRQYTATGYGRKIPTERMIRFAGKLRRVYCCIFSNVGTCYIVDKDGWIIVR